MAEGSLMWSYLPNFSQDLRDFLHTKILTAYMISNWQLMYLEIWNNVCSVCYSETVMKVTSDPIKTEYIN